MSDRLVKGATFTSFEEFDDIFKTYQTESKQIFSKKSANLVSTANKRCLKEELKLDEKFVYRSIIFQCKKYGEYSCRGNGARPNQR